MADAPEFLTVKELAELLRVKERKVYDMAANGSVPCSRATGKLLFPRAEIRAWIEGASSGAPAPAPTAARPPIVLGSHDPLLDWAIRASGSGLATFFDGSGDGLARFVQGEGVAAGLHLYDQDSDDWNVPSVAQACAGANAVLVGFARRSKGLVIPKGSGIAGMADLAGKRVAPRQDGSGTALLFAALAARDGLAPDAPILTDTARTETEAVEAVARGDADATLGLAAIAQLHDLSFVPLTEERFDLLVDRRAWFDAPMQAFMAFCRGPVFRDRAKAMGGYDVAGVGSVRWNA